MEKKQERKGLGRGLSALMADVNLIKGDVHEQDGRVAQADTMLPIERVLPNPNQPRRDFDPALLEELAASIRAKGIIQPLVVRAMSGGRTYQIVAGERRWRAAQMAQLHSVPVVVRDFSDEEVLEIAIIENIQRADLNAVEEALGFRQLMDNFGHTQEKLAEALSKSRSHVANTMRLLSLPDDVLSMIRSGKLTAGHARALIGSADPINLALKVVGAGLSVRDTEKLARTVANSSGRQRKPSRPEKDADTRAIESDISANLGMMINIDHDPSGEGGSLRIRYKDLDQLDMLCQVLSVVPRDFTK
ncbi:ParB/RepB/Spo0J family partition protein [Pseudotabrizicola alkalilacus]|uniref:ParB/RepB/Spo0J family partition protein n=1 Tax=Pseudotabrizicola alkalilacus TaxID=2305252 RepID=A0A411YYC3_9RHOB|nr:ParB/RepB/Spo0J family partition protein [Pseudotabrizicola alkalilacus]RGP35856.1 ParB/RepB/Spo0J family partition protein [Pseudotabrizicola alkalilacus]